MKNIKTVLLIILVLTVVNGQRNKPDKKNLKVSNIEQFYLIVSPQASSERGKIELNTHVMIPSFSLQFVKENGGFVSSFEARISLLDEDGKQIDHKSIQETLNAQDYLETVSKSNWYFIEHDFLVIPGKYTIVSEVLDIDTRNSGVREKKVDFTKYKDGLNLFPPLVLVKYTGSWQGDEKLMASYQNEITFEQSFVPIYITGNVSAGDYSIKLDLKSTDGESISSIDTVFTNSEKFFNHQLNLPVNNMQGLRAKLYVELEQEGKSEKQSIELKIKRPGVSSHIRDVEEAMDQMRYILTSNERSKFSKVKKNDREELFYTFWKERDPTPETAINELMEQYYSRVRYANEHFTSFTPGWRTDMGMIYILFGPPDDIERIFMSSDRNANQTWHYYRINRSFTFYDQNGFGDYRLTTPYITGRAW
ncbi:MAG: GWxTD domain-containing protein [Candidatus Marinimicrobia bacterium]|nr:GWxTD domain-containing protein [Candidatus Neomarinimicrobiota bacterium]